MADQNTQTVDGFFYTERDALTRVAARKVLRVLHARFGSVNRVLDVGCGVGTWLAAAAELGAKEITGVEGPWIGEVASFAIRREAINVQNLEQPWSLPAQYDLGICLEVAEHLSPPSGDLLVKNLASNCELVLFSAAIPGQGGNGHINEQWPSYWQDRFAASGMEAIDCIRPLIWADESVPWWYRQNIVVFASRAMADQYYNRLSVSEQRDTGRLLPLKVTERPAGSERPKKSSVSRLRRRVRKALERR